MDLDKRLIIQQIRYSTRETKKLYYNIIYGLFLLTWTLILWTTTVYKMWTDGVDFFHFFTNWNWSLQTIFFTMELCAFLVGAETLRIFNFTFVFWIINGTTWLVFWLVFYMVKDNAIFFLLLSNLDGGKYEFSVVLNGHALFHVLISISILVFVVLQKEHIDDSVSLFIDWKHKRYLRSLEEPEAAEYGESSDEEDSEDEEDKYGIKKKRRHGMFTDWDITSVMFLIYIITTPLFILATYASIFDIRATYGIVTEWWELATSAVAIVIVFNGLYAFGAMMYLTKPKSHLYLKQKFYKYFCCQ